MKLEYSPEDFASVTMNDSVNSESQYPPTNSQCQRLSSAANALLPQILEAHKKKWLEDAPVVVEIDVGVYHLKRIDKNYKPMPKAKLVQIMDG